MHHGLVSVLMAILLEAGVPKSSVVKEKRGFRPENSSRPGDLVALDFFGPGRHLLLDAVVTTIYRNAIMDKASKIPGHAAKLAEDRKFDADKASVTPVSSVFGGDHVLVPFAMEDGGRFGAHALALAFLRSLAEHAVSQGVFCAPDSFASLKPAMQVSLWVQRWQQRLSAWLHVSLSRQLLRLYQPADSFDLVYG